MPRHLHQALPASGPAREELRQKGQFWTPQWVADAMASYVMAERPSVVFDPAVGAGAFFAAAKREALRRGYSVVLRGNEIDPQALHQSAANGLTGADLAGVSLSDFVLSPPADAFPAIIANPPYLRHHRIGDEAKRQLKAFGAQLLGKPLDGRAGLHVYFLLRMLERLAVGGRLAAILPADVCEGVFSSFLWKWIAAHFRLDAAITFDPQASPFPRVDTNAVLFLIRNAAPQETVLWTRVHQPDTDALYGWVQTLYADGPPSDAMTVQPRQLKEALQTGLSRPPCSDEPFSGPVLGDFVSVQRGIATGANEFFFLTKAQAQELGIAPEFLLPTVGRTRDVNTDVLTLEHLAQLDAAGRPTLLFSPDGRALADFPEAARLYLQRGAEQGLPQKALISQRKPWYKMEVRSPTPPFLFAYLGRRNARFIRNDAEALPLTGFLCVYPKRSDLEFLAGVWRLLQQPETVAALSRVGKSYGEGAIKVEPRALERLPLSVKNVQEAGLISPRLLLEDAVPYEPR